MSEGKISFQLKVDTTKFHKQLRRHLTLRFRIALFLIDVAEKISGFKLNYSIEQEKGR